MRYDYCKGAVQEDFHKPGNVRKQCKRRRNNMEWAIYKGNITHPQVSQASGLELRDEL